MFEELDKVEEFIKLLKRGDSFVAFANDGLKRENKYLEDKDTRNGEELASLRQRVIDAESRPVEVGSNKNYLDVLKMEKKLITANERIAFYERVIAAVEAKGIDIEQFVKAANGEK